MFPVIRSVRWNKKQRQILSNGRDSSIRQSLKSPWKLDDGEREVVHGLAARPPEMRLS